MIIPAQLKFSGPWENLSTQWHHWQSQKIFIQPNLTNQFSTHYLNPAGESTFTLALDLWPLDLRFDWIKNLSFQIDSKY